MAALVTPTHSRGAGGSRCHPATKSSWARQCRLSSATWTRWEQGREMTGPQRHKELWNFGALAGLGRRAARCEWRGSLVGWQGMRWHGQSLGSFHHLLAATKTPVRPQHISSASSSITALRSCHVSCMPYTDANHRRTQHHQRQRQYHSTGHSQFPRRSQPTSPNPFPH